VPERFRQAHPAHRKEYSDRARVRPMGIDLELFARPKDGSEFPVDIMLGPVETAEGRIVLSVIRDLTEKRETEEALQRSEREKRYLEEELNTEMPIGDLALGICNPGGDQEKAAAALWKCSLIPICSSTSQEARTLLRQERPT
jgi:PAS domain-containing protein